MLYLSSRKQDRFGAFLGEAKAWPSRVRQLVYQSPVGAEMSETDLARAQAVAQGLRDMDLLDSVAVLGGSALQPKPAPAAPSPGSRQAVVEFARSAPPALRPGPGSHLVSSQASTITPDGKITGTFCSHYTYRPTAANLCLERIARVWGSIYEAGGPARYCNPADPMTCGAEPWKQMPAAGKRFQKTGSIPRPGVEGTDFLVLSFLVPDAWDGVLVTITNQWDGAGFVDGSGDLRWRLMIDNQWVKDLHDVRIVLGRLENPYELEGAGYRLQSHQQVRYFVQLGPGALGRLDPNGRITCACSGWFYPRN